MSHFDWKLLRRKKVIPADRRPPEKEETWTLPTDQQDPCVLFDDTVKPKGTQDEKTQLKPTTEAISVDTGDNVDNTLPRSQETRKSKTKKVKNYLRKCKGALSKGDESVTEKKRQENCTSWYLEDIAIRASQEDHDESAERYTEFLEERLEETTRDTKPVENLVPETLESFLRDENLEETPDEAFTKLLEEDRRIDLSRSGTPLYEDARGASLEPHTSNQKTPTKKSGQSCDEEKKDVVLLETLITEDTNLNKCDSNDTLIAEILETAETATSFNTELTAEEGEDARKTLVEGVDEEAMLAVLTSCANRGDFASLVRNLLGPIYGDGVMNLLIRQARDILVCAYHGNLDNFVRIYLSPAAALLAEVKNVASETENVQDNRIHYRENKIQDI